MITLNNRVFSKKINNKSYFGFDKTIYLVENGQVKPATEKTSEFRDIELVESNKDDIVDNGNFYTYVDKDGNEFEVYKDTKDIIKNGKLIDEMDTDVDADTIELLSGLLDLSSSDITINENGVEEMKVDGVEETISINEETEEPEIVDEEIVDEADNEELEAVQTEIDLIVEKIESLNDNIKKLEEIDISDKDDLQNIYIQELGKLSILEKRLEELDYVPEKTNNNMTNKLLESYGYIDLSRKSVKSIILNECKLGNKVYNHIRNISKVKFLESFKDKTFESDDIRIDNDGEEFIISGDISKITEEKMVVTDKKGLFESIDKLVEEEDISVEEVIDNITKINKPTIVNNKKNVLEAMIKPIEVVELVDNKYYVTTCDLYRDSFDDKVSKFISDDSYLFIQAGTTLRYNKENDVFLDVNNNLFNPPTECLKSINSADKHDLVVGGLYNIIGTNDNVRLIDITNDNLYGSYTFEDSIGESITLSGHMIPFTIKSA